MKKIIEVLGVIGLWGMGMITTASASWSIKVLLGVAVVSTLLSGIYAWWAIFERRGGDSHYFLMASVSVALTVTSLVVAAERLPGGAHFLWRLLAAFAVAIAVFVVVRCCAYKRRLPNAS